MAELHSFNPDWCIAPAATLQEWMEENGVSARLIAATCAPRGDHRVALAEAMVTQVLDRQPLTGAHAAVLERGTHIPVRFWLALEHNYRAGLAAGLTDATGDAAAPAHMRACCDHCNNREGDPAGHDYTLNGPHDGRCEECAHQRARAEHDAGTG